MPDYKAICEYLSIIKLLAAGSADPLLLHLLQITALHCEEMQQGSGLKRIA